MRCSRGSGDRREVEIEIIPPFVSTLERVAIADVVVLVGPRRLCTLIFSTCQPLFGCTGTADARHSLFGSTAPGAALPATSPAAAEERIGSRSRLAHDRFNDVAHFGAFMRQDGLERRDVRVGRPRFFRCRPDRRA